MVQPVESRLPHPLPLPQGLMFGYATDETEECMPLTIVLAHKLNAKLAELRRNGTLPWLRPDSKTQVRATMDPNGEAPPPWGLGGVPKTPPLSPQTLPPCLLTRPGVPPGR